MTGILIRERQREVRSVEGTMRRWSRKRDVHKQGTPRATKPWERRGTDSLLEPLEGAQPCWRLDAWLLASRTVTEYGSIVWRPTVCGDSLQGPHEGAAFTSVPHVHRGAALPKHAGVHTSPDTLCSPVGKGYTFSLLPGWVPTYLEWGGAGSIWKSASL